VITAGMVPIRQRPLVFLDLAMPRHVEPAVAGVPGMTVIGMQTLRAPHRTRGRGCRRGAGDHGVPLKPW
jgi:glutamyl-tRNA reductase